jgi:hypothetical protein
MEGERRFYLLDLNLEGRKFFIHDTVSKEIGEFEHSAIIYTNPCLSSTTTRAYLRRPRFAQCINLSN